MEISFPPQSNAADWIESIQVLSEDDNAPVWSAVPSDLVLTMNVKDSRGCLKFSVTNSDGSGAITAFANGFIEISVDDATVALCKQGRHSVLILLETDGYKLPLLRGHLPIIGDA
jgi:hypothetical protein